jgi:hypothetical protein
VCLFDGVHVLSLASPSGGPGALWQLRDKYEGDGGEVPDGRVRRPCASRGRLGWAR